MKFKTPILEIQSEVGRVKMVRVGSKIPCFYCKDDIVVSSTKDILCNFRGIDYGLCQKCYPEFSKRFEAFIKH